VYPLSLVQLVFGSPVRIHGARTIGGTGVDEQVSALMEFGGGRLAVVSASIRTQLGNGATIHGTEGMLRLESPLYFPHRFRILSTGQHGAMRPGRTGWRARLGSHPLARRARELVGSLRGRSETRWPKGNGYEGEAAEVVRCLRAGLKESPSVPLDDTIAVLEMVDAIRRSGTST
jgi:predicted dehydrogenase